jgi:hypothetical protein
MDHVFIGYGSDHPSDSSDHTDNSSTTSSLQRKDDQRATVAFVKTTPNAVTGRLKKKSIKGEPDQEI